MNTVSTKNVPNNCWVFSNHQYICHSSEHGFVLPYVLPGFEHGFTLPYVHPRYERLLKSNNIPYRKINKTDIGEVCEYWNPEVYEEETLTLPLYAKMPDNSYRYCEKYYTGKVVTLATFRAAEKIEYFFQNVIDEYDCILNEVAHYQYAKEQLAGGICKVCYATNLPYQSYYEIEMNYDSFVVFRFWKCISYSDWVVIFDRNKIIKDGYITLQVPKQIAGMIIGEGGKNVKKMADILQVKKIQVIPV